MRLRDLGSAESEMMMNLRFVATRADDAALQSADVAASVLSHVKKYQELNDRDRAPSVYQELNDL